MKNWIICSLTLIPLLYGSATLANTEIPAPVQTGLQNYEIQILTSLENRAKECKQFVFAFFEHSRTGEFLPLKTTTVYSIMDYKSRIQFELKEGSTLKIDGVVQNLNNLIIFLPECKKLEQPDKSETSYYTNLLLKLGKNNPIHIPTLRVWDTDHFNENLKILAVENLIRNYNSTFFKKELMRCSEKIYQSIYQAVEKHIATTGATIQSVQNDDPLSYNAKVFDYSSKRRLSKINNWLSSHFVVASPDGHPVTLTANYKFSYNFNVQVHIPELDPLGRRIPDSARNETVTIVPYFTDTRYSTPDHPNDIVKSNQFTLVNNAFNTLAGVIDVEPFSCNAGGDCDFIVGQEVFEISTEEYKTAKILSLDCLNKKAQIEFYGSWKGTVEVDTRTLVPQYEFLK